MELETGLKIKKKERKWSLLRTLPLRMMIILTLQGLDGDIYARHANHMFEWLSHQIVACFKQHYADLLQSL